MMNRSIARLAAATSAIICATAVHAQEAVPAVAHSQLEVAGQWMPMVVFVALLGVVGVLLLATRPQQAGPSPWELEEAEADLARAACAKTK